jgi:IS1 family transposase
VSLRGLERIFGVARQTIATWIYHYVRQLPPLRATLLPAQPDDILELDEAWSFVRIKVNKQWLWTVMCRRTRQIIAFAIGDRSADTCRRLWKRVPKQYRHCTAYSDFWAAYQTVLPADQHRAVGKESGEVNHMERWYNTLRQRLSRYVRKTLSFSKSEMYHHLVTKWFIYVYNLAIQQQASLTS